MAPASCPRRGLDAGRRVSSILRGFTPALREELKQNLLWPWAATRPRRPRVATAAATVSPRAPNTPAPSCGISRARSCNHIDERDPSATIPRSWPSGSASATATPRPREHALGRDHQSLLRLDLRFALGNLMLLKGRPTTRGGPSSRCANTSPRRVGGVGARPRRARRGRPRRGPGPPAGGTGRGLVHPGGRDRRPEVPGGVLALQQGGAPGGAVPRALRGSGLGAGLLPEAQSAGLNARGG